MLVGYKTMLFNAIMAVVLVYRAVKPSAVVPGEEEVSGFLDQLLSHGDALIAVVGNVILRYFTKTSVFASK